MKIKWLMIVLCTMLICLLTLPSMAASNLALNKTITANNYTQVYVATNANDGNVNTYWEGAPNAYPNTLTVDLGSSQTINNVVVKLNTAWGARTQTFSVLGSIDNSTYTTLVGSATYTFNPSTNSNSVGISFNNTNQRYVRLNFAANSGATGGQVAEFEVYGPGTAGTPDLIVTDITMSPASPAPGNAVRFSAVVKNQGTGATPGGVIIGVSFLVDGAQVNWSDTYTTSLAAGVSVTLTANSGPSGSATWTATSGTHTVTAWVDDVDRIPNESNESNNQYSESFSVGSATPTPTSRRNTPTPSATMTGTPTATPTPGNSVNLALGKSITANNCTQSYVATNANDGNVGTYWEGAANSYPNLLTVDLGTMNNNINFIKIKLNPDAAWATRTQTLSVLGSNDNATFTTIVGSATYTFNPSTANTVTINVSTGYRYIRLSFTVNSGATGGQTAEFEVWGTAGPTPTATPTPTPSPSPTPGPTATPTPTLVPGSRGATMPYTRYESENASYGGGAVLRSALTFDYTQIAAQASNQKYVELPSNGSYVEWTVSSSGAGVNMRFTMPDTGDGMGQNGSLDCYVNGAKVSTIALSSYWMWQYFAIGSDQPQDAPNGGRACFAFDEFHWKLPTALKSGDRIRIQSTGDLVYGVDFLEIEAVPAAIGQPANSLSVTAYGAVANDSGDDLAAFNSCVSAAVSSGKSVYIPAGTFNLSSMWVIGSVASPISNITITGAGIWYTNLQFTNPNSSGGGISIRLTATGTIDFSNVYLNSRLRSRYNQNAIYKCFMDNFGTNSKIHDFWEEHFECGFWVGDYAHTPAVAAQNLQITNGRIRNNLADGVNFCQGTSNSIVQNCSVRNNGDDGLAVWPDSTMGAPMGVNNKFNYNTIENNWRAAAIAIFGGSGHSAANNYISDCFMGSGIRLNTVFPGYHFENNTGITFSNTTIINCGTSSDCYNGERGAIDLEASTTSIRNITFENIDIINAQRDAIQIGYGGGFTGINFNNITINGTGKDAITTSRFTQPHLGMAIMTYTSNGTVTFRNLVTNNIEAPEKYLIQTGFVINFL